MKKNLSNQVSRMCCVCRGVMGKDRLIRVVKTPGGEFEVDMTGRAAGRGAYICKTGKCMDICVKKKMFNKSFKCNMPETVYARLKEVMKETNNE